MGVPDRAGAGTLFVVLIDVETGDLVPGHVAGLRLTIEFLPLDWRQDVPRGIAELQVIAMSSVKDRDREVAIPAPPNLALEQQIGRQIVDSAGQLVVADRRHR